MRLFCCSKQNLCSFGEPGYLHSCQSWWSRTEYSALFVAFTEQHRAPLGSWKQNNAAETVWMSNKYLWPRFAVPWPTSAKLTVQNGSLPHWNLHAEMVAAPHLHHIRFCKDLQRAWGRASPQPGHCLGSPITSRLQVGLAVLNILFRLILLYWVHSCCPTVLLKAFLISCTALQLHFHCWDGCFSTTF